MKLPLTKFHGSQIELLLKQQDRLWETEPLKSAQCELEKDIEVGVYVRDLKQMWSA
jgi:hypothetical protein